MVFCRKPCRHFQPHYEALCHSTKPPNPHPLFLHSEQDGSPGLPLNASLQLHIPQAFKLRECQNTSVLREFQNRPDILAFLSVSISSLSFLLYKHPCKLSCFDHQFTPDSYFFYTDIFSSVSPSRSRRYGSNPLLLLCSLLMFSYVLLCSLMYFQSRSRRYRSNPLLL